MAHLMRAACMAACLGLFSPGVAAAGPYADDLAKCLVRSTTDQEKAALVKWMFVGMSLHPDVRGITSVTADQRTEMSRATGKMFERLLTENCRAATQEAVRYEGPDVFRSSFAVLGQVATTSLFNDSAVSGFLAEFTQYMDQQKVQAAILAPR